MGKYVQIPLELMERIIGLLDCWDFSQCDDSIRHEHECVSCALLEKMSKIRLRESYSQIVFAKGDGERDDARIEYLKQKRITYRNVGY